MKYLVTALIAVCIFCFSTCGDVQVVIDGGSQDGSVDATNPDGGSAKDAGTDGSIPDGASPDGGTPDATLDGGVPDGSEEDSGMQDAGVDGGAQDAAVEDASTDGGVPTDASVSDAGNDGGGYSRTCSQIYTCMSSCGSDSKCKLDCYNSGSQDGQEKFLALDSCLNTNCAGLSGTQLVQCMYSKCNPEFQACIGGGSDGGTPDGGPKDGGTPDGSTTDAGTLTCVEMMGCVWSCGMSNVSCIYNCYKEATPDAKNAVINVISCTYNQCSSECAAVLDGGASACQICTATKCSNEWSACLNN